MRLSKIFKTKSSWCQNANAILDNGCSFQLVIPFYSTCQKTNRLFNDFNKKLKKVKKWSLYGAISYYIPHESKRNDIMFGLRQAIQKHTGKKMSVGEFNDDPSTKFEDIVEVIRIYESSK